VIVMGRKLLKYALEFVSNERGIRLKIKMLRVWIDEYLVSPWKLLIISGQTFSLLLARN